MLQIKNVILSERFEDKMKTLKTKQIKRRIFASVALIVSAIMLLFFWQIMEEKQELQEFAEKQTAGYAKALSEHSERTFAETSRVIKDVLHEIEISGKKPEQLGDKALYEIMKRQTEGAPQIGDMFFVNSDGVMFNSTNSFPPKTIDVSDREYFKHFKSNPKAGLTIGKPVMSRLVNRWRFNLMLPLSKPVEKFDGLIAVAFETDYFKRFFDAASVGSSTRIMLVDTNGRPLVVEPNIENAYNTDFKNSLLMQKLQKAESGTFYVEKSLIDSSKRIVSYQRLKNFPVISVVSIDTNNIENAWKERIRKELLIAILLSAVILILAITISRHLNRLESATQELKEQKNELEVKGLQVDTAQDAILLLDMQGRILQCNQALAEITGYSIVELQGKFLYEIEPDGYAEKIARNIKLLIAEKSASFESAYISKEGVLIPIDVRARLMEHEDGIKIVSVARDIRKRKLIERREAARTKLLEKLASDETLERLLSDIVLFVEEMSPGAFCSVLLADHEMGVLRHGAAPSLPSAYNRAVNGIRIANRMGSCGTAAFLKSRVVVEDIATHPYWKGFTPAGDAGLRSCWSEPVISPDGKLLGTFAIYHKEPKLPTTDETKLIEFAASLASIAISKREVLEQQKELQAQLQHIHKIESIGQLAGGIAHDFNNLLTPILVYAEMLKSMIPEESTAQNKISGIANAANRAKDLTHKLLSVSRKHIVCMSHNDTDILLNDMHDIMQRSIGANIKLSIRSLSDERKIILCDKGQIEQIILNLILNARDAVPDNGGEINITTDTINIDNELSKRFLGMEVGKAVRITVIDNGCGMSQEVLSHIFEPFFTTKEEGRGTGLGLAMVYGIVKQHDGYISVESRSGEGSRFDIYFHIPENIGDIVQESTNQLLQENSDKGAEILLVEDNEIIRNLALELLEAEGYKVIAIEHPAEAVEQIKGKKKRFDLLITDMIMPEMNGKELYDRIIAMEPGLPVIFMSGYTNEAIQDKTLPADAIFLNKPFSPAQFYETVAKALTNKKSS